MICADCHSPFKSGQQCPACGCPRIVTGGRLFSSMQLSATQMESEGAKLLTELSSKPGGALVIVIEETDHRVVIGLPGGERVTIWNPLSVTTRPLP